MRLALCLTLCLIGLCPKDVSAWALLTRGDREEIVCVEDSVCEDHNCVEGNECWDCLDVTDQGLFSTCPEQQVQPPRRGFDYSGDIQRLEEITIRIEASSFWLASTRISDQEGKEVGRRTTLIPPGTINTLELASLFPDPIVLPSNFNMTLQNLEPEVEASEPLVVERITGENGGERRLIGRPALGASEPRKRRFSLSLGAGIAWPNGFKSNEAAFVITPKFRLSQSESFETYFKIPIIYIPGPYDDPWASPCFPDRPPCPFGDFFAGVRGSDLEVGPTLMVAPEIEFAFHSNPSSSLNVFGGLGVAMEQGRTTTVEGGRSLTTDDATLPLLTFGLALENRLTDRLVFRLEGRGITTFGSEMLVEAPDGTQAVFEGSTVTTLLLSAGLRFDF